MYKCFLVITILLSFVNTNAQTPLAQALSKNDTVTAINLIKAGEDPNQLDALGNALLISHCRYSEADPMAFFLLRHGAKPDTLLSAAGRTALHVAAAYYACEKLCGALLDAGANINARTKDNVTPLMLAANSAKLRLVKFLIEKGADIHSVDNNGKTAYDYALKADALSDLPEFRTQMEESCGFNKAGTIAYLKEAME